MRLCPRQGLGVLFCERILNLAVLSLLGYATVDDVSFVSGSKGSL